MRKTILLAGIVTASAVIVVSFFMPWAKADGSVMKTAGRLAAVMGFGATARIRTQKILDLSSDLPMVVEIVDEEAKVAAFQAVLTELFEEAGCGGLVTLENIRVVHYLPAK